MKKIVLLKWSLLLLVIVVLSACSELESNTTITNDGAVSAKEIENKEVEVNEDLLSYPTGIQEGLMTSDYYDSILTSIIKYTDFVKSEVEYLKLYSPTNSEKDELKDKQMDFLLYLKDAEVHPFTDLEYDIEEYVSSMFYHMNEHVNYSIKYLNTNDRVYQRLGEDEYKSASSDTGIIFEIMKRNNIN